MFMNPFAYLTKWRLARQGARWLRPDLALVPRLLIRVPGLPGNANHGLFVVQSQPDIVDSIARLAGELPNRPMRRPLTSRDALAQVAATGGADVRALADAEIRKRGL